MLACMWGLTWYCFDFHWTYEARRAWKLGVRVGVHQTPFAAAAVFACSATAVTALTRVALKRASERPCTKVLEPQLWGPVRSLCSVS